MPQALGPFAEVTILPQPRKEAMRVRGGAMPCRTWYVGADFLLDKAILWLRPRPRWGHHDARELLAEPVIRLALVLPGSRSSIDKGIDHQR